MLIGELDHRANAVSIALLLAKVALLAATRESDHDAVRTICPSVPHAAPTLAAPRAPILPDNAGTPLDWVTTGLTRTGRSPRT
jgi:hypothetical protein